jgi:hypothetical protein
MGQESEVIADETSVMADQLEVIGDQLRRGADQLPVQEQNTSESNGVRPRGTRRG